MIRITSFLTVHIHVFTQKPSTGAKYVGSGVTRLFALLEPHIENDYCPTYLRNAAAIAYHVKMIVRDCTVRDSKAMAMDLSSMEIQGCLTCLLGIAHHSRTSPRLQQKERKVAPLGFSLHVCRVHALTRTGQSGLAIPCPSAAPLCLNDIAQSDSNGIDIPYTNKTTHCLYRRKVLDGWS